MSVLDKKPEARTDATRVVAMVALTLAVLVAGCGGGDVSSVDPELPSLVDSAGDSSDQEDPSEQAGDAGSAETSNDSVSPADADELFARFEACMAEHGIEVEGIGGGAELEEEPGAVDPGDEVPSVEDFEAAQEECNPILDEAFGDLELSPEQEAEFADAMLAVQRCMDDKGFDVDVSSASGVMDVPVDVDFEEFDAALSGCEREAGLTAPSDGDQP